MGTGQLGQRKRKHRNGFWAGDKKPKPDPEAGFVEPYSPKSHCAKEYMYSAVRVCYSFQTHQSHLGTVEGDPEAGFVELSILGADRGRSESQHHKGPRVEAVRGHEHKSVDAVGSVSSCAAGQPKR